MAEQIEKPLISYLVHVHFVLTGLDEAKYESAYADMVKAGLHRRHQNAAGLHDILPKGSVMGVFTGYDTADVVAFVRNAVMVVLANLKLKADVSIMAGQDAAWVAFRT